MISPGNDVGSKVGDKRALQWLSSGCLLLKLASTRQSSQTLLAFKLEHSQLMLWSPKATCSASQRWTDDCHGSDHCFSGLWFCKRLAVFAQKVFCSEQVSAVVVCSL